MFALEVEPGGAVWLLVAGEKLLRDGTEVVARDPAGTALAPRALASDDELGIVVLAAGAEAAWLLAAPR